MNEDRFKFRALVLNNNQIYDVVEWNFREKRVLLIVNEIEQWYRLDKVRIMQCTGLEDVEGNLIYEGDTLLPVDPNNEPMDKFIVEWDNLAGTYSFYDPMGFDDEYDTTTIGWAKKLGYTFEIVEKEKL